MFLIISYAVCCWSALQKCFRKKGFNDEDQCISMEQTTAGCQSSTVVVFLIYIICCFFFQLTKRIYVVKLTNWPNFFLTDDNDMFFHVDVHQKPELVFRERVPAGSGRRWRWWRRSRGSWRFSLLRRWAPTCWGTIRCWSPSSPRAHEAGTCAWSGG